MKYAIFLNGEYPKFNDYYLELLKDRIIYCADGGANFLSNLNIFPKYLIGDLDSVNKEVLEEFKSNGVEIISYSLDKDYTDFSLVLLHICGVKDIPLNNRFSKKEIDFYQNKDILVFGATGKRLDMTLSNLKMLLNNSNMKYITHEGNIAYSINKYDRIVNKKNKKISLIPMSDIKNLSLKGLLYELENKDISKSLNLVSNVVSSNEAIISFDRGEMLVILEI